MEVLKSVVPSKSYIDFKIIIVYYRPTESIILEVEVLQLRIIIVWLCIYFQKHQRIHWNNKPISSVFPQNISSTLWKQRGFILCQHNQSESKPYSITTPSPHIPPLSFSSNFEYTTGSSHLSPPISWTRILNGSHYQDVSQKFYLPTVDNAKLPSVSGSYVCRGANNT